MVVDRRGTEGLGVLVVEPKEFVAARLKGQLERLGHRVLGLARDGREAVAAAQRLQPNLVLMESALPGLDGIDTARAIVSDRPVPVILLTGYVGAQLVRRAREAGVVAHLTSVERKPLRSAIEIALERFGELGILRREGSDPNEARATRRLVDRAKTLLIARLGLSEGEAFRHILDRTLHTRRSLRETAGTLIASEEVLGDHFARSLLLIFHDIRRGLRRGRAAKSHRPAADSRR